MHHVHLDIRELEEAVKGSAAAVERFLVVGVDVGRWEFRDGVEARKRRMSEGVRRWFRQREQRGGRVR